MVSCSTNTLGQRAREDLLKEAAPDLALEERVSACRDVCKPKSLFWNPHVETTALAPEAGTVPPPPQLPALGAHKDHLLLAGPFRLGYGQWPPCRKVKATLS